jgi:hypothetical protein
MFFAAVAGANTTRSIAAVSTFTVCTFTAFRLEQTKTTIESTIIMASMNVVIIRMMSSVHPSAKIVTRTNGSHNTIITITSRYYHQSQQHHWTP